MPRNSLTRSALGASALAVLALLVLLVGACSREDSRGDSGAPAGSARNLLIVCVDTLRADELGAYGAKPTRTPALDRLAGESVVFERAHVAASWTLPSVGALFTSQVPSTTKLWTFESRLSHEFTTLAERFQAAGFATHGIASHIYFDDQYGLQQGFESFDDELCHRSGEAGWKEITSPEVSAKAVAWLEQRAARADGAPWLLFVHFFDAHLPYLDHQAADPHDAVRSERERYRSEIAFTDGHVGALLEALERAGLAADTNVLFFSDHGEAFLEHPPIRRHSYGLYEEELRVPLFLRVPGFAPRRVPEPVRTVDLLPTLLELHGLATTDRAELDGVSLVPALRGAPHAGRPQLAEIRLKDGFHANALVRGRHKLIEDVSNGRLRLFDLEADPGEQRDLAQAEPALVAELAAELRAAIAAAEARGARFASGAPVEHSAEDLERLRVLGYAGDDEPDDEPGAEPQGDPRRR